MPKYILTEGITEKLITFIYNMVAAGKTQVLKKKFEKDPKFIKLIEESDRTARAIESHLKSMEASTINNPDWVKI